MKIFIPSTPSPDFDKRALFLLCRPFFKESKWLNDERFQESWGLMPGEHKYTDDINEAEIMFLPYSVNHYHLNKNTSDLNKYNELCKENKMKAYAHISGDWGLKFPEFENIIYFRMSGFRSQLGEKNQGFPAALSDHFYGIFGKEKIDIRVKGNKPVVGFCGHASLSSLKRAKENIKCIVENFMRAVQNPSRSDWEPLFASAYHRALLLNDLTKSELVESNFVTREKYRGGAKTAKELEDTTIQYYDNLHESDYVFCLRGGGNFSIRFYETLMMGRIPLFVNTDCLLPQTDRINWKKHTIWVEWNDRKHIAEKLLDFHNEIHPDDFKNLQLSNRNLWKNELSVSGMLAYLHATL